VEIEIKLARGVYSEETVDALFAFTDCEQSISVNLLVIKNSLPVVMTVTEIIKHHAGQLVKVLTKELEIEKRELLDKLHLRTLERIFIEERIYKGIEKMKTAGEVEKAVLDGFQPFMKEVGSRGVSHDDVEHLLRIPIRRISLYDINKARGEMREIAARVKEINDHLKSIVAYALNCLDGLITKIKNNEEVGRGQRKTKVGTFEKVDVKEVIKKDLELKYDRKTGYLGTAVSGDVTAEVSPFDRVITIRNNGSWSVADLPEKSFVGPGAWYIAVADQEVLANTVFTIIYRETETGLPYIKRCVIEGWIMNKEYSLVPEGTEVLHIDTRPKFIFTAVYKPKPRLKVLREDFKAQNFAVKGLKANGVRLSGKEILKVEVKAKQL
jgi:topoisomerase-4 subunit A